jgi:hypothetical protein
MTSPTRFFLLFAVLLQGATLSAQIPVSPDQIEFRRMAVKRMIFDQTQAIPLASLQPAQVIDLDLMHPELLPESRSSISSEIEQGRLLSSAPRSPGKSSRWVGGFNPFATYDLTIGTLDGSGSTGVVFQNSSRADTLSAELTFRDGKPDAIRWSVVLDGNEVVKQRWKLPEELPPNDLTLRVQMAAVGANLFVESSGRSLLIGYSDFSEHLDLRERAVMNRYDFAIACELEQGATVALLGASAALTPGSGQADIRAITDREGAPLLDEGRLWFTITLRGRALPHPLQGVFSLNPSVFDIRFEGIIVFDLGDGLLRNELASHLFYDAEAEQWRGWTTGFSALANSGKSGEKTILAVSSTRDPRRGFSVMKARAVGIDGAHEDPHGVYDREAGKWRLLLCERHQRYRAGLWQSDHWDRGFTRLSGPVEMDSTGTLIQQFGDTRYILFGSADRKVYIRSYPDLQPAGELKMYLPPWDERHGTRIWPNIVPLPEGYPAPYIALMMDRVNFPGMPTRNWTYGALYLYHGHP